MIDYIATFIFFFAVIDPIGTVPVFIAVTSKFEASVKRKIAIKVPLASFQIAGGIVLFLFALTMIFGESKPDEELKSVNSSNETAIFPLSVPSIASPGAMLAAVLMTENAQYTFIQQVQTTGVMLSVMLVVLLLMLASSFIHRYIGYSGASIISRVMGLILSSVAVNNVLEGVKLYFSI